MASPDSHKKARIASPRSSSEEKKRKGRESFSLDVDRLAAERALRQLSSEANPTPSSFLFEATLHFLLVGVTRVRVGWLAAALCACFAAYGLASFESLFEQLLAPALYLTSLAIQLTVMIAVNRLLSMDSRNMIIGGIGASDITGTLQFLRTSKPSPQTEEGVPTFRTSETQLPAVILSLSVALSSVFFAYLLDYPWEPLESVQAWKTLSPFFADFNRFLSLAAMIPLFPNTAMMTWLVSGKFSTNSWQLHVVSATIALSALAAFLSGANLLGVFFTLLFLRHLWWKQHLLLESIIQRSSARQVMIPWDRLVTLSHGLRLSDAKAKALHSDQEFFPVMTGVHCQALLKRSDLLRFPLDESLQDSSYLLGLIESEEIPLVQEDLPLAKAIESLPAVVTSENGTLTGLISPTQVKSFFVYSLSVSDDLTLPEKQ